MAHYGRVALALLVAAAGAVHLYLYFDYFHRVHVVGALFLVNAAAGLLIGAALLVRRDRLVLLAALGYSVGTLVGFVVSTRWGLFGYHETFWEAGRRSPARSSSRRRSSPRFCSPASRVARSGWRGARIECRAPSTKRWWD